mmetsp:Transcript_20075/g.47882  ORF Transcript_20075/g.47882 Transcript_20075/m.47882 type:complete len:252 (+) Transcript_20075:95-850(+)
MWAGRNLSSKLAKLPASNALSMSVPSKRLLVSGSCLYQQTKPGRTPNDRWAPTQRPNKRQSVSHSLLQVQKWRSWPLVPDSFGGTTTPSACRSSSPLSRVEISFGQVAGDTGRQHATSPTSAKVFFAAQRGVREGKHTSSRTGSPWSSVHLWSKCWQLSTSKHQPKRFRCPWLSLLLLQENFGRRSPVVPLLSTTPSSTCCCRNARSLTPRLGRTSGTRVLSASNKAWRTSRGATRRARVGESVCTREHKF